jgi:hypothetical protein
MHPTSLKLRSARLAVLGVLAFTAIVANPILARSSGDAGSEEPGGEVEESREETVAIDAAELSKTLGIPFEQELAALQRQPQVSDLNVALTERGPSGFGGLYVDHLPTYEIHVVVKPGRGDEVAEFVTQEAASDLSPHLVIDESEATTQAMAQAREIIREAAPNLVSDSSSDLSRGIVEIGVRTEEDVSKLMALIADLPLPIPVSQIEVTVGGSEPQLDSFGGLWLGFPGGGHCTTGFSVSQVGGGPDGVTTAAHCPNNGFIWGGSVQLDHVFGIWQGHHDVQWAKTPGAPDDNRVKDNSSDSSRPITGRVGYGALFNGYHLCRYGATTGYKCGEVIDPTYEPECEGSHCFLNTFIRAAFADTAPGDSGGPWYFGQDAVGTHYGSRENGDQIFQSQSFMHQLVTPNLGVRPKVNP